MSPALSSARPRVILMRRPLRMCHERSSPLSLLARLRTKRR